MDNSSSRKNITTIVAIMAIVLVTGGVSVYGSRHKTTATDTSPNIVAATPAVNTAAAGASTDSSTSSSTQLKDGTYSAISEYSVPHGNESIKVTLTVKNGTISDSQIVNSENDRDSADYQEQFAGSYKSYVVGKKASGLHIPYVAGASDTTDGFNSALDKIVSQAQV